MNVPGWGGNPGLRVLGLAAAAAAGESDLFQMRFLGKTERALPLRLGPRLQTPVCPHTVCHRPNETYGPRVVTAHPLSFVPSVSAPTTAGDCSCPHRSPQAVTHSVRKYWLSPALSQVPFEL